MALKPARRANRIVDGSEASQEGKQNGRQFQSWPGGSMELQAVLKLAKRANGIAGGFKAG